MTTIDTLGGRVSRRAFTAAMSALALVPRAFAQSAPITLRKVNCFEIGVADIDRSIRFYQRIFGMPVQARAPDRVCLRVGNGPQFMAIRSLQPGETPAITHLGYSVDDYDVDRLLGALANLGFERIDPPPVSAAGIEHTKKTWVRMRGATPEIYFADDRGLIVQLSDPAYCGGAGAVGSDCGAPEPAPEGALRLHDLNHFTVFVNDGAEANRFYQDTFGLSVQAYQGPQAPVTGIGDGSQFVMYAGQRREERAPANIHHGCFTMHDFDVERVLGALTDNGLVARGDEPAGPLVHYVSLRMPERGGAEGGTPELYFTDPDGLLLQLQDVSYCGGGGYFGSECLDPIAPNV